MIEEDFDEDYKEDSEYIFCPKCDKYLDSRDYEFMICSRCGCELKRSK
jgi:uncharacterized paraquat-inducible protein A